MGEVMTPPFEVGEWIQWTTEHHVKRGEVIFASGPSLQVRWLGGEEQSFPVIEGYVGPRAQGGDRMERIERPQEARRIEREVRQGIMSVTRAAASLGTTPKRIRAMLRSGQLTGIRKEGKWASVDVESVNKLSP